MVASFGGATLEILLRNLSVYPPICLHLFPTSDNLSDGWIMSVSQVTTSLIIPRWWQTGPTLTTDLPDRPHRSSNQSIRVISIDQICVTVHISHNDWRPSVSAILFHQRSSFNVDSFEFDLCNKLIAAAELSPLFFVCHSSCLVLLHLSLFLSSFALSSLSPICQMNDFKWFRGRIITHCLCVKHTSPTPMIDILYMATPSLQPSIKHQACFHQSDKQWSTALGWRQLEVLEFGWFIATVRLSVFPY